VANRQTIFSGAHHLGHGSLCATGLGVALQVLSVMLALSASATVVAANSTSASTLSPKVANLLDFIGALEAPDGYDSYSYYASAPPPKPLTQMSIAEVLAWQDKIDPTSKSEAAGRFQIMNYTLRDIVKQHGINPNLRFNEETQNRLALLLLERRGWHPDSTDYISMANSIAHEWAALPLVSGPDKGKSAHHNTKGAKNRAQTSPAAFLDVLKNGSNAQTVLRAVKLSRSARRIASVDNGTFSVRQIHRVETAKPTVTGGAITPSKVIVYTIDPYQQD
jgi:hypothetical protein